MMLFLKGMKVLLVNMLMSVFVFICPFYVPFIYRYAQKARWVVYSRWLIDPEFNGNFKKMLFKHSGPICKVFKRTEGVFTFSILKGTKKDEKHLRDFDNVKHISYNQMNFIQQQIYKIRYNFWFYMVWIWLDDNYNVNGLDSRAFDTNESLNHYIIRDGVLLTNYRPKYYESVFDQEYASDTAINAPYSLRFYICNMERSNNYLRLNVVNKEEYNGLFIKYKWNENAKKYTLRIAGHELLFYRSI